MATHREVQQRKAALKESLRIECRAGRLAPGDLVPSERELGERFGVSKNVAAQSVQELVNERLFYKVARTGTFVGSPMPTEVSFFLLVVDDLKSFDLRSRLRWAGFEEQVAHYGAVVRTVDLEMLQREASDIEWERIAGIFDLSGVGLETVFWKFHPDLMVPPQVRFSNGTALPGTYDSVAFDDVEGGLRATQHLIRAGHSDILFVGMHCGHRQEGFCFWSAQRQLGWTRALAKAGLSPAERVVLPERDMPDNDSAQTQRLGRLAAERLENLPSVTAAVVANDFAAMCLVRELEARNFPQSRWPALVGFDDEPALKDHQVTSLRLPWNELGQAAAELLWERSQGKIVGVAQHRLVKMRLIARLTCRPQWAEGQAARLPLPV